MEVIKLIRSKNRCLKKFLQYSQDFLSSAEQGNLTGLQILQSRREATLKAMVFFDKKITESIAQLSDQEKTAELIESIKTALNEKEVLIREIFLNDKKIISKIEEEKERLLKELSKSDKSKKIVKKFKSKWIPQAGEKLDGKI